VETLLLHFLRGSGLAGLVGMQPRQQDIIRPLLEITHAQTVSYCQQHAITPLEDLSNSDPRFTRNRIRHQLLPLLESINPGLRATLLRNANVLLSDLDYIETQVDACWPAVILSEQDDIITLSIPALLNLHESLQHHLLRRVTAQLCNGQSPLELRHYALLDELLHRPATQEEHTLHLPSGLRASRVYSTLTLRRVSQPAPPVGTRFIASTPPAANTYYDESVGAGRDEAHPYNSLSIPGEVDIPGTPWRAKAEYLPSDIEQQVIEALQHGNWQDVWRLLPPSRYVVYINAQVAGSLLRVRVRRPGDRMQPLGMRHEKKVQDILVDAHIPRGERDTLPLFFSDTHCLWLAGVCIDERAKLTSQTRRIVRLSIEPARS
jgi:tRNA(Ile)-lysidine synthase